MHPTILGCRGTRSASTRSTRWVERERSAPSPTACQASHLDPVDVITGPGNVYVAAAKRLVRGVVGIDSEAGPTEILVIADATADAELVAADLVSQAEHDELAAAVLVTDSPELAVAVSAAVERRAGGRAPRASACARRSTASSPRSCSSTPSSVPPRSATPTAPEHLELQTEEPGAVLDLITNAGAIFLGASSPVSLGDYLAGSNHVLPTGGQSRFSSGLGAYTFLRPQQVISYDRERPARRRRAGLVAPEHRRRPPGARRRRHRALRRDVASTHASPEAAARRVHYCACSARSAATLTVASSTRARATTDWPSDGAGSARSAVAGSAPPRPHRSRSSSATA